MLERKKKFSKPQASVTSIYFLIIIFFIFYNVFLTDMLLLFKYFLVKEDNTMHRC